MVILLAGFPGGTAQAAWSLLLQDCVRHEGLFCPGSLDPRRRLLLPDLQTLPPTDLRLVGSRAGGRLLLRFTNSVVNTGPGVLDLRGTYEDPGITVDQRVYAVDGTFIHRDVGEFHYHAAHSHYHWEGFSLYEIWSTLEDGTPAQLMATSGKVSYCMLDSGKVSDHWLEQNKPEGLGVPDDSRYRSCGWYRQGISVGWVDIYESHLPGQSIDVTYLPDGKYALRSVVDPEGILAEASDLNNAALVYFTLAGDRLVLP